ncbi:MAG TPA: hypothetical protein VF170_02235, partial [Planctomycetaceae bacterium]
GVAENDQKARILSEVLRQDLATRTFRSVYPFRFEPSPEFAQTDADKQLLLELRQGYFSISENDPGLDTDDVLALTVSVNQERFGQPSNRLHGRASALPTPPTPPGTPEENKNQPELDDAIPGNGAGASGAAEVVYFLRNGNLYRSTLLVRDPLGGNAQPSIDPAWTGTHPFDDYRQFSTQYPTTGGAPRSFWQDFDYAAYRWDDDGPGPLPYLLRFHGPNSLSNNPTVVLPDDYHPVGGDWLWVPQSLGVPHLRFGHLTNSMLSPLVAWPLEFSDGPSDFQSVVVNKSTSDFFGRFTVNERSDPAFTYPGTTWAPFDGTIPASGYPGTVRRGVDLMLSNVHSFDIKVWDDVVGGFVDLGHELTGTNPFTGAANEPGFYHRARLRRKTAVDHPAAPDDFGNRYDTWHPHMFVGLTSDPLSATGLTGRAPYRPQIDNADPNAAGFAEVEFGEDDPPPGNLEPAGEVPLRAIRITIRYLDPASGQTRQTTIEHSLID